MKKTKGVTCPFCMEERKKNKTKAQTKPFQDLISLRRHVKIKHPSKTLKPQDYFIKRE